MSGRFYIALSGVLCTLLCIVCISTAGASLTPTIVPPESGSFRGAAEPIRINFPPDIPEETYQQLALELDAIDISALVSFDGDQLIFQPPQPLQYGPHELRLVQYLEDGSIEEVALWSFEVRQSAAFRQLAYSLNSTISASHRFAEDTQDRFVSGRIVDRDAGEDNGFQGGATLRFAGANQNTSFNFQSNFLADHQSDNTPRGKEFDLGNYLLEFYGPRIRQKNNSFYPAVSVKAGHHSIDYDSLIFSNFNRRGISGELSIPFLLDSSVYGFSMNSSDLSGFNHGLGVSDSDNLVNGFVWEIRPLSSYFPHNITFKVSHLNGERNQEGFNIGGLAESNAGDASSISADFSLFDRAIRFYSELSQSNYDFDGEGEGFGKEKDNAYHSFITYSPKTSDEIKNPLAWNVGLEKLVVGPDFRSLANTFLTSDKDMTRVFFGARKGQWSGDASFAYEENNLDNDFEATGIGRYGYISGNFTGLDPHAESGFLNWLGVPSYGISYEYSTNSQAGVEVPQFGIDLDMDGVDDVIIIETDLTQQFVNFSADFYKNEAKIYQGFSAGIGWSEFQDHAERFSDSQTVSFSFGPNFKFGNLSVTPSVEANTTHERDTHFDATYLTYNLGINGPIIDKKLSAGLNFSYTDFEAKDDPTDRQNNETLNIRGNIVWSVLQADGLLPGIDFRLTGSYQDLNDDVITANDGDEYQLFFNVDVNWGIGKPASFY